MPHPDLLKAGVGHGLFDPASINDLVMPDRFSLERSDFRDNPHEPRIPTFSARLPSPVATVTP